MTTTLQIRCDVETARRFHELCTTSGLPMGRFLESLIGVKPDEIKLPTTGQSLERLVRAEPRETEELI